MDKLDQWIAEIERYNRTLHLVSPGLMAGLKEDALNCQQALAAVDEPLLADLGSGSGLPAIPFHLIHPTTRLDLIERSSKKCQFLKNMVLKLRLEGVTVRAADALSAELGTYPAVMARAFSPKTDLEAALRRLLEPGGRFYYVGNGSEAPLNLASFELLEQRSSGPITLSVFVFRPC
ncbi:MAG: Ribosomal RNA small subunit methyltransferase G [Deltaproteobacteria bacterium ADurb.Bin510]|nr:MAG: Ribosomal RNA small subunit methyltransferase G [Deltaproteobacteria bacterium ADurb.Bin510]